MDLLAYIHNNPYLILDGGMGTQLDKRGLMSRGRNNLDAPHPVLEVHREYIAAGSNAIITNTLTMNRIYIETHDVGVSVDEVNRTGVRIARETADGKVFVLGDMCSTGQMLEPYGDYTEEQFLDNFREQASILAEGVDAFIIETMFDLNEAICAVRACKEVADLPVIVGMAFSTEVNGGRTMMGNSAEDCARRLAGAGADVVGANCGEIGPHEMASLVEMIRSAVSIPIMVEPNAGKPQLVDGKTAFDMGPDDFAAGVLECYRAGATLLGGCCGTSPDHIRALAERLEGTE